MLKANSLDFPTFQNNRTNSNPKSLLAFECNCIQVRVSSSCSFPHAHTIKRHHRCAALSAGSIGARNSTPPLYQLLHQNGQLCPPRRVGNLPFFNFAEKGKFTRQWPHLVWRQRQRREPHYTADDNNNNNQMDILSRRGSIERQSKGDTRRPSPSDNFRTQI